MKGQRFDAEFKKDIVKLYLSGARTCPSLEAELGIHENTIYKWIQQYKSD
ncbi:transposase, partial [Propionispora sp. 2/2-37]